jgi:hypothetical protein
LQIGATIELYEIETLARIQDTVQALKDGKSLYGALTGYKVPVWMQPQEIRERLGSAGFTINVAGSRTTILQSAEAGNRDYCISYFISSKPRYSSVHFTIYAKDFDVAKEIKAKLVDLFADKKIDGIIFGIRWCFAGGGGMQEAESEEIFEDVLHDEAYPDIVNEYGSLEEFVKRYIKSDESILILQGPPGTGKTRLIRLLLARLTNTGMVDDVSENRNTSSDDVLYTGDSKLFESDGLFARFIIGDERALVVEDADYVLESRAKGNKDIHRFLTTSDGLISSTGRKIIFSTNLPNLNDVDEALTRPGRCFARLSVRTLDLTEAVRLLAKLMSTDVTQAEQRLRARIGKVGKKEMYSLAEIYKASKNTL